MKDSNEIAHSSVHTLCENTLYSLQLQQDERFAIDEIYPTTIAIALAIHNMEFRTPSEAGLHPSSPPLPPFLSSPHRQRAELRRMVAVAGELLYLHL